MGIKECSVPHICADAMTEIAQEIEVLKPAQHQLLLNKSMKLPEGHVGPCCISDQGVYGRLRHYTLRLRRPGLLCIDEPPAPQEEAARAGTPASVDLRMNVDGHHVVFCERQFGGDIGVTLH